MVCRIKKQKKEGKKMEKRHEKIEFNLIDPNVKIKQKTTNYGGIIKTAILTINLTHGQTKYDILKEFNKNDSTNPHYSKFRLLYLNYMNTQYPESNNWTNIRPTNAGYSYLKFYPKNNPVKFTLTYQVALME